MPLCPPTTGVPLPGHLPAEQQLQDLCQVDSTWGSRLPSLLPEVGHLVLQRAALRVFTYGQCPYEGGPQGGLREEPRPPPGRGSLRGEAWEPAQGRKHTLLWGVAHLARGTGPPACPFGRVWPRVFTVTPRQEGGSPALPLSLAPFPK